MTIAVNLIAVGLTMGSQPLLNTQKMTFSAWAEGGKPEFQLAYMQEVDVKTSTVFIKVISESNTDSYARATWIASKGLLVSITKVEGKTKLGIFQTWAAKLPQNFPLILNLNDKENINLGSASLRSLDKETYEQFLVPVYSTYIERIKKQISEKQANQEKQATTKV